MGTTAMRRWTLVGVVVGVGVVGTIVVGGFVVAAVARTTSTDGPIDDRPPPASVTVPTASVPSVAADSLRAARHLRCGVTWALTTSRTWAWCDDPVLLSYGHVGKPYAVSAAEAGRSEECVDFTVDTRGSSDGSMPVGRQPWSPCFVRTSAGWRLWDQGQG